MSQLIYTIFVECRSCGHEQTIEAQIADGFSDADIRDGLDHTPAECNVCYEINWAPVLEPEKKS